MPSLNKFMVPQPIRKYQINSWTPWFTRKYSIDCIIRKSLDIQGYLTLSGKLSESDKDLADYYRYAINFKVWIALGLSGVDTPRQFVLIHDWPTADWPYSGTVGPYKRMTNVQVTEAAASVVLVNEEKLAVIRSWQEEYLAKFTHYQSDVSLPVCGATSLKATDDLSSVTCPSCKTYVAYRRDWK